MRTLFFLVFALNPLLSFAQSIITDHDTLKLLNQKLRKNQYYRKVGPVKYKIFDFEIGRAQTPFYQVESKAKRFYRNANDCFELSILASSNVARKVKCQDKVKQLHLTNYPEFQVVDFKDLVTEGLTGFNISGINQNYELLAFVQHYDMYSMDRAIYGEQVERLAPRKNFLVQLKSGTEVLFTKKRLELQQNVSLMVGKIGILSEKTLNSTRTLKKNGDGLYFSNNQGKVVIYNPPTPAPFGDYSMTLNPKLPIFLNQLSVSSLSAPVCFRDNYVNPGPRDCHKIIFGTHATTETKQIQFIELDFVNQSVRFR